MRLLLPFVVCFFAYAQQETFDANMVARSHEKVVVASPSEYSIKMEGTMDGANSRDPIVFVSRPWVQGYRPMRFVRLENLGATDLVNPRLFVNGKRNWRTTKDIVAAALSSYGEPERMSAGEKARAIWDFVRLHRFHASTGDEEVRDPVKLLNVYGYGLCGDNAPALMDLWRVAGLKVRRGFPTGHCISEVWYDGMWHILDADEPILVLGRDNKTVLGEEALVRDHDLLKRIRGHERSAALYVFEGTRSGEYASYTAHAMDMRLRPGEAIEWRWDHSGKHHYSADLDTEIHLDSTVHLGDSWGPRAWKLLANGKWLYKPPLRDSGAQNAATAQNVRWSTEASGPAVSPLKPGEQASLTWRLEAPYVMVGGKVRADFQCEVGSRCAVLFSDDGKKWIPVAEGNGRVNANLDQYFPNKGPARYGYFLRVELLAESARPLSAALESLEVDNDLQMAPLSLPELEIGENQIRYADENNQGRRAKIVFDWVECSSAHPPKPVDRPLYPSDGAEVEGTLLTLRWPEADDPEGIVDYHFQLSDEPGMRWALSPNFDVLLSDIAKPIQTAYSLLQPGLLNPGERYYWRVKAKSKRGVWGRWSPVWTFVPRGPGVPLNVRVSETDGGQFALEWEVNPKGHSPKRYEVYASNEKGFTISDSPFETLAGNQKERGLFAGQQSITFPANRIGESGNTEFPIRPEHAFYRVVAVDERGVRSGPSDIAASPRPYIFTQPPNHAKMHQPFRYEPKTITSIGDLRYRAFGINPDSYQLAYWDAEKPRFSLVEEIPRCGHPDAIWLMIDPETGILSGKPHKPATYHINVQVEIPGTGAHVQSFALEVTP